MDVPPWPNGPWPLGPCPGPGPYWPGPYGPVPAVQPRTGLARTRLALAQDLLARIPAGRADTAAPGRRQSALARSLPGPGPARPVLARSRLPSPVLARAARPWPGRRHGGPHRGRPLLGGLVSGSCPAAAPLPVASRRPPAPPRCGPVPAGQSCPGYPWACWRPGARDPDSPDPDTRAPARRARPATRRGPGAFGYGPSLRVVEAAGRGPRGGAGRAGPGAAGRGGPAGGGDRLGAAGGGQRPASRPRDAARAGRPSGIVRRLPARPGRVPGPAAACRAPAGFASARAACPRGGAARGPCCSCSPGSRDQRGRRRLPGTRRAGRRRGPRRRRRWPGRACLGQARCPDDSPGTSWTKRAALATPRSSVGRTRLPDRTDG